jgi:hypothetical protein
MSTSAKPAAAGHDRSPAPSAAAPVHPAAVCVLAWLVPGAGHLLVGKPQKAVVFFVVLVFMFTVGIAAGGRLFPFLMTDPLVFLAGLAEWGLGLARVVATLGGYGDGQVTAATYEYGNTFLIAAGLLNAIVVLDAFDVAIGRKPA